MDKHIYIFEFWYWSATLFFKNVPSNKKKSTYTYLNAIYWREKIIFNFFFIVLIKSTTNKLASYDSLNLKLTVIRRNWIIILHRYNFVCNQFGFCNNFIIYSVIYHLAMRNSIHLMQDECKISHDTPAGRTI